MMQFKPFFFVILLYASACRAQRRRPDGPGHTITDVINENGIELTVMDKLRDNAQEILERSEQLCPPQEEQVHARLAKTRVLSDCIYGAIGEIAPRNRETEYVTLDNFCKMKGKFLWCFNNFTSQIDKCIATEDKNFVHMITEAYDSFQNLVCAGTGKVLVDVLYSEVPWKCIFENKRPELVKCLNSGLAKHFYAATSLKNLLTFSPQYCSQLDQMFECLQNQWLGECSDRRPSQILSGIQEAITRGITHCPQQIVSFSTSTSIVTRAPRIQQHGSHNRQSSNRTMQITPSYSVVTSNRGNNNPTNNVANRVGQNQSSSSTRNSSA